jgi:hypothetical protein
MIKRIKNKDKKVNRRKIIANKAKKILGIKKMIVINRIKKIKKTIRTTDNKKRAIGKLIKKGAMIKREALTTKTRKELIIKVMIL